MTIRELVQQPSVIALAWMLIHFVWQGALLGGAAFVLLRLVRPDRASTRYAVGVATLALMPIACAATFVALTSRGPGAGDPIAVMSNAPAILAPAEGDVAAAAIVVGPAPAPRAETQLAPVVLPSIVIVWVMGVLVLTCRLAGGWWLTRRLAATAVTSVPPALEAAARRIADRLELRRAFRIVQSRAVTVPTLVGWAKPVVLLPVAALSGLSPDQLQAIIAHELAHVRRHDYLINLLQSIIETLLFYHPATWWVSAQVRAEREHCCDDVAVEVCGDRLVYVSALAELTTIASHRGFALAATDGSIVSRVRRILGRPRSLHEPAPAWPLLALVLAATAAGAASAASGEEAVIPRTPPIRAQKIATWVPVVLPAIADRPEVAWAQAPPASAQRESQVREAPPAPPAPPPPPAPASTVVAPAASVAPQAPPKAPQAPAPTPKAPKAPAVPETPSAPPAPEIGSRGSGNMSWSDNGEKFSLRWTGEFRLTDDEKDIAWIEDGARVTIAEGHLFTNAVTLTASGGRIERRFTKSGFPRDYEPEGRLLVAAGLDKLIRTSGAFARQRVARFLQRGGPDAVLAEIDRLSSSSYVRRVYYSELLKQAPATDGLLTRVLQRASTDLRSDYEKATLLTQLAEQPALTDAHRIQIARAAKTISSDYEQRRALSAALTTPLSPALAEAVLDASGSISSNHERSTLLIAVAERGGLSAATGSAFMGQVRALSSSHDQRRVLAAATRSGLPGETLAVEAARAAGGISSSHDKSEALLALIDRGGLTDSSANAFFEAIGTITSSHDMGRVLRAVLSHQPPTERIMENVLRTTPKVSSSHDRANVLLEAARRGPVTGQSRQLYIAATTGMSDHDENRVLAALIKAEAK